MELKGHGFKFWFYLIYRVLLVLALGISLLTGSFLNGVIAVITLMITFIPSFIERKFKVQYPSEFEIALMIFIFLSLVLGSMGRFYEIFPWWDIFLHTLSGVLIGLVGFSMVYLLNRSTWEKIRLSRAFVALFAFCFSMAFGVIWEIYEYTVDGLFGWNMQRSGLNDTMTDLIVYTIGTGIIAVLGYLYLKGEIKVFDRIEERFIIRNKDLFRTDQDTGKKHP
jgi:hypothetical protein